MKLSWINYQIDIQDIPYDIVLKNTIEEAEYFDRIHNTEYFCVADGIDMLAKQLKTAGKITQEQWDRLCRRYPGI